MTENITEKRLNWYGHVERRADEPVLRTMLDARGGGGGGEGRRRGGEEGKWEGKWEGRRGRGGGWEVVGDEEDGDEEEEEEEEDGEEEEERDLESVGLTVKGRGHIGQDKVKEIFCIQCPRCFSRGLC